VSMAPPTLASLAWHWGDAYLLSWVRDRWVALRRDARYFLVASTLPELETLITADHRDNPVSRDYDPPGAGDYLEYPGVLFAPGDDSDHPDDDQGLDAEALITIAELRRAFPAWAIIYSTELGAWIATTRTKTISQHSAVSLAIALTLIERREWQLTLGTGRGSPLGDDGTSV
jgi:hypothetical protein